VSLVSLVSLVTVGALAAEEGFEPRRLAMNSMDYAVAWAFVGLAAAIAGCVWPFRTGVAGIVINMLAAMIGAVATGYAFIGLGFSESPSDPRGPMAAAMGALAFLAMVHVMWGGMRRWRLRLPRPAATASRPHLIFASAHPRWSHGSSIRALSHRRKLS
jgi:hypothetical protein